MFENNKRHEEILIESSDYMKKAEDLLRALSSRNKEFTEYTLIPMTPAVSAIRDHPDGFIFQLLAYISKKVLLFLLLQSIYGYLISHMRDERYWSGLGIFTAVNCFFILWIFRKPFLFIPSTKSFFRCLLVPGMSIKMTEFLEEKSRELSQQIFSV